MIKNGQMLIYFKYEQKQAELGVPHSKSKLSWPNQNFGPKWICFSEYSRFFIQKNCRYKNGGPRKLMGTKNVVKQWNWIKKMLVLKNVGIESFG